MPRPCGCRRVHEAPVHALWKPAGVPAVGLRSLGMGVDEWEAIRLADYEGLYHEAAAERMGVSRPTFGRILESARRKLATVLVQGLALKIEGGEIMMVNRRLFVCAECGEKWEVAHGTGRPAACPKCGSANLHRAEEDRGYARAGRGPGQGEGRGRRRGVCARVGGGGRRP